MKAEVLSTAFVVAAMLANSVWTAHGGPVLANAGTAQSEILVPQDAPPSVQFAAELLQSELLEITGAKLPISSAEPRTEVGQIHLRSLPENHNSIGRDGIHIYTDATGLHLEGEGTRGPLYAVAEFLDGVLGCRYWTKDAASRPKLEKLEIPELDIRYTPPFEYRYPFWTEAFSPTWSLLNKANGTSGLRKAAYGGNRSHGGVHTFFALIPPADYFQAHPEWFSQIDGKRTGEHTQLCLTNPDMKAELIKNLRRTIDADPDEFVFSVSQNDWFGYCQCPQCQEVDAENGGPSGTMVSFVNDVAAAIEADYPNHYISTLAYQYTRKPPTKVRPRQNVIIQLCSIECSFSVPLTADRNQAFADDIVGWSKIADRLYIWDYTTNFRHYFLPHPNLNVLGPNLRFFADHKVRGVFEQGAYTTLGAEFTELRSWVLARLLWNPALDDKALIEEFCRGYYGPAASNILRYIEILHASAQTHQEPAWCLPSYAADFPFLTLDVLKEAMSLFEDAKKKTATESPDFLRRVEQAQLPVLYATLLRWNELEKAAGENSLPVEESREELAKRFEETARNLGVTRVNEWEEGFGLLQRILEKPAGS